MEPVDNRPPVKVTVVAQGDFFTRLGSVVQRYFQEPTSTQKRKLITKAKREYPSMVTFRIDQTVND